MFIFFFKLLILVKMHFITPVVICLSDDMVWWLFRNVTQKMTNCSFIVMTPALSGGSHTLVPDLSHRRRLCSPPPLLKVMAFERSARQICLPTLCCVTPETYLHTRPQQDARREEHGVEQTCYSPTTSPIHILSCHWNIDGHTSGDWAVFLPFICLNNGWSVLHQVTVLSFLPRFMLNFMKDLLGLFVYDYKTTAKTVLSWHIRLVYS